jgi:predicted N-acetyltransferase YhbS
MNEAIIQGMLLARMGVHEDCQKNRLGDFLIRASFALTLEAHEIYGCSVLLVDPKEKVRTLYPKYGFQPLPDNAKRLYITIPELAKRI